MVKQLAEILWLAGAALVSLPRRLGKPGIPELGQGLAQGSIEGGKAFDARVKHMFPVGSPVEPMVEILRAQRFEDRSLPPRGGKAPSSGEYRAMTYRNGGFPVHSLWSVRWREDQGSITEIWGVFGHVGP